MRLMLALAWLLSLPLLVVSLAPGQSAPKLGGPPGPSCGCPRDPGGWCDCKQLCHCKPVEAKVGGRKSPDGTVELQIDLPAALHRKNIGSPPPNGPGCCVFTALHHMALWQGVSILQEFPQWMVKEHIPGGGYPEKVAKLIKQKCQQAGCSEPDYIQVQGTDLEILKLACATGRMPGVTYSFSPTGRYQGQRIAHMVNLAHADDKWTAVLDNNYMPSSAAGEPDNYEWNSPQEFARAYAGTGGGWAIILLDCSPPPVPRNKG